MKNYILKSDKSPKNKKLINEALDILENVGVPITTKSERGLERMAVCFLAVAGVAGNWKKAIKGKPLKTRDVIQIVNKLFQENISPGSYDDIRRKDLKQLVAAGLIINSGNNLSAATNDPTRGYAISSDFHQLIITYGTSNWKKALKLFNKNGASLAEILQRKRELEKLPVRLPSGKILELSFGKHNELQKQIIEEFLPRFGSDCEVLYIGDTSNKILFLKKDILRELKFFDLSHDALPDIIAYSHKKNWLYLIEAVYSSGPMSELRVLELKKMLNECTAEIIYVTTFLTKADFKKWILDIAWETEVWTADNKDHLIHFNGHKFLGPMNWGPI